MWETSETTMTYCWWNCAVAAANCYCWCHHHHYDDDYDYYYYCYYYCHSSLLLRGWASG